MAHTLGPWALGADGEKIITDYRDAHGNMTDDNWLPGGWAKSVAIIRYAGWMSEGEARANGRMLSASTEMLHALKEMVIAFGEFGSTDMDANERAFCRMAYNLAEKAIDKAEGRS